MSLDLGALLEPLSVAIQAAKRAQLQAGATVLVFGAGAVGLLVAAMAKISGAGTVVIADIDAGRVEFAVKNNFADQAFTVPMKRGSTIEEQLEIAKETAVAIGKTPRGSGGAVGEVDAVFECTGVPSCVQASIYVSNITFKPVTLPTLYRQHDQEARCCLSVWERLSKHYPSLLLHSEKSTSLAYSDTRTHTPPVLRLYRRRGQVIQTSPSL